MAINMWRMACVDCERDSRYYALQKLGWLDMGYWEDQDNLIGRDVMNEVPLELQLDPEDIILLLLEANEKLLGKRAVGGVTRLEKLLFLLQRETNFERMDSFYEFAAHNFGPFSKEVYESIDFLEGCGLIQVRERTHSSYYSSVGEILLHQEISEGEDEEAPEGDAAGVTEKLFILTKNGRKVADKLRQTIEERRPKDLEELNGIVRRYANLPLNQLIRYVYRKYPKMTVKSIHPEAKQARSVKDPNDR